jgi:hypothetical protein
MMDYLIDKLEDMLAHAESDVESYYLDDEGVQYDMGRVKGLEDALEEVRALQARAAFQADLLAAIQSAGATPVEV